jgi:hypothetical protein
MSLQSERAKAPSGEHVPEEPAAAAGGLGESAPALLVERLRGERLSRMSPEQRATYERIVKLREAIGPIDFDVVEALRELRCRG